ncbi:hypothetical protein SRB17_49070 [Streptomyces sp. RB17]|nr:hypothetical protein [Streptomyces sp. RB17]
MRSGVNHDLGRLFLLLACVCLVIGAVGITNTTLVAVMERTGEIGPRRALGAGTRHILTQFLTESTVLGTLVDGADKAAAAIGRGEIRLNTLNLASPTATIRSGSFRQPPFVEPKTRRSTERHRPEPTGQHAQSAAATASLMSRRAAASVRATSWVTKRSWHRPRRPETRSVAPARACSGG